MPPWSGEEAIAMRMKAAVLYGVKEDLVVEEVELDPPQAGEVLVKMVATGICHHFSHHPGGPDPLAKDGAGRAVWRCAIPHALERICLLGCGFTTGFGAATNAIHIRPGETVTVVGCGGLGLAAIQGAKASGAGKIIAVDVHEEKLTMARKFGVTVYSA